MRLQRTRRQPSAIAAIAALVAVANACAGVTGHLAAASTVPVSPEVLVGASPTRHIVGRSCIRVLGVFPTGLPKFGDAITDALKTTGGTFLTDVTVRYEIRYVPFVYGWACYAVEGNAQ